jgi:uncharacterized membrane protein
MPAAEIPAEIDCPQAPANLTIRLGALGGLAAVVIAIAGTVFPAVQPSGWTAILGALSLVLLILWLAAIGAFQQTTLSRLGHIGGGASVAGLSVLGCLNIFQAVAPAPVVQSVMGIAAPGILAGLALCSLEWGLLALGTASLRAGRLPRGSIVLWMAGLTTLVLTSWLPIIVVAFVGMAWTSLALLRARAPARRPNDIELPPPASPGNRLLPLDALRGTIMALMAIDHASLFARRWHPFEVWDQPLPDYPSLAAMLTRLATHPCAPGFFFLMGAGMLLLLEARRKAGWSDGKVLGHLALRGLLFIALEQLIVDVVIAGRLTPLDFSILAGLGAAMLLGIPLLRLSGKAQALLGGSILLGMQVLPAWMLNADLGALTPIRLLLLPGAVGPAFVLYPPIPWLGVSLLGMAFGRSLLLDPKRTYRLALVGGLACLALFTLLRLIGGFGNLRMPSGQSLIDFFTVVKYPPSLSFLLLSLGFDLVLLSVFSRATRLLGTLARPLVTLGQAALYFFIAHWFIYSVIGNTFFLRPSGLPATYLVWIVGVVVLYPICKAYEAFKHSMPITSVWRMI